jgi:hypothetical protein
VEFTLHLPVLAMIPQLDQNYSDKMIEQQEPVLAGAGSKSVRSS